MGLEPIRGCPQQILSLPRLPFRHAGISLRNIKYIITKKRELQAFFENNVKNLQFPDFKLFVCFFYQFFIKIKTIKSCKII